MADSINEKEFFDMASEEIKTVCKKAVAEREGNPTMDDATQLDERTGRIIKKFKDSSVEDILR